MNCEPSTKSSRPVRSRLPYALGVEAHRVKDISGVIRITVSAVPMASRSHAGRVVADMTDRLRYAAVLISARIQRRFFT